jgi:hypothetical protein
MAYKLIEQIPSGTQKDANGTHIFEDHYMCDAASDLTSLPTTTIADGSLALIPSTGALYTLYDGSWVLV